MEKSNVLNNSSNGRPKINITKELLQESYKRNKSWSKVAKELNVSYRTIRNRVNEFDLAAEKYQQMNNARALSDARKAVKCYADLVNNGIINQNLLQILFPGVIREINSRQTLENELAQIKQEVERNSRFHINISCRDIFKLRLRLGTWDNVAERLTVSAADLNGCLKMNYNIGTAEIDKIIQNEVSPGMSAEEVIKLIHNKIA